MFLSLPKITSEFEGPFKMYWRKEVNHLTYLSEVVNVKLSGVSPSFGGFPKMKELQEYFLKRSENSSFQLVFIRLGMGPHDLFA
jgi:hypothetical protein